MRVLLVEDDAVLADQIRNALVGDGRAVDWAADGEEGGFLGGTENYAAVVLDVGLPKRDGLSILREWRSAENTVPVLLLTARDGWTDRVEGLDAGADDYLVKPFHMAELLARVRALIRRHSGRSNPLYQRDNFTFDTRTNQATVDGAPVTLTANEAKVLSYLVHNAGRFVSQSELSDHVYDYDTERDSNTIVVFVGRLRKKLGPGVLHSERGKGYRVDPA